MLKNYIKVAWRNIRKQRLYATINLLGLTVGMTCFILIALYIQYELSFDTQHERADQLYRVYQQQEGNEFRGTDLFGVTPLPLATTLESTFPEVEAATSIITKVDLLAHLDKAFMSNALYATESFFDVFNISITKGIGAKALANPNSILLSESLAQKYFGEGSPIGKTLLLDNNRLLTVDGVFKDIPTNQHLQFEYITSLTNCSYHNEDNGWASNNYHTYVSLSKVADHKVLEEKFAVLDEFVVPAYQDLPFKAKFLLQPIRKVYLTANINFNPGFTTDVRYLYLLTSVAFIILLLAAINYTNLATAASLKRSKEIGMRKVMGAKKVQLIAQLLSESFLLTGLSFVLALGLVYVLLPFFSHFMGQPIAFDVQGNRWLLVGMLSTALLIGGLSGLYPAFFLSTVSPSKTFKGSFLNQTGQGNGLRNWLIIGQFAAAIVLAVSSVVVYQQLQYIQNKKLGFNRDQIVYVPFFFEAIEKNTQLLQNKLLAHPNIKKTSTSTDLPLNSGNQGIVNDWEGSSGETEFYCYRNYIDENYLDLFEIELLAGRNFSSARVIDSTKSYILNEAAVAAAGWTPASAIGKGFQEGKVIGVVQNFHFQPMDLHIEPLFMMLRTPANNFGNRGNIAMKIHPKDVENTLAHIQQTFKEIAPGLPVNYHFMDESYDQLYESEQRLGKAFGIFTLLALLIACIGLLGLVSYNVVKRTKEIGIRKVLGASVPSIVQLLSIDFLKLVFVALFIATPIAYYFMNNWLQDFAYRIELQWWVFALAGLAAIGIALLTVSVQSVKAALANPVNSLRSE